MQNGSSLSINCRGSHQKVFWEKSVLKNFANFTGKELARSLVFDKVVGSETPPPVKFVKL